MFFYCNHCKGLSGSISFPGQLSFSVRNRVLRESFFTKYVQNASYWHLSLSVCTINPTYRNLFTTSSLWHFLLPDLLCARGALTTVYNFCKTKTTQIVAMVFEGFIPLFYQTFNFNLIKKERERQCLPLRLSLLCLLWNSLQLSGEPQRSAQAHKKTHIKRARELLYFVCFVQSKVTFKIINYSGMCFTGWQQLREGTKGLRQKDGLRQKF